MIRGAYICNIYVHFEGNNMKILEEVQTRANAIINRLRNQAFNKRLKELMQLACSRCDLITVKEMLLRSTLPSILPSQRGRKGIV